MNDQQLTDALRAIGTRPVQPDPQFAERLWVDLSRTHARRLTAVRRDLVLVAAALLLLGLAIAIAVGTSLLQDRPLLVQATASPTPPGATAPGPTPAASFPFAVAVPEGIDTLSTVAEVQAAALALDDASLGLAGGGQRIVEMLVVEPGRQFPDTQGGWTTRGEAVWGIDLRTSDDFQVVVYLVDGSLDLAGAEASLGEPEPEATIDVLPTWDPASPIQMTGAGGTAIQPMQVPVFEPGPPWQLGRPVAIGDRLWLLATPIYTDDPPHLIRVDTQTGDALRVDAPEGIRFGALVAGLDRLWLADDFLYELDPETGEVRETLPALQDGTLIAEDANGLWWRVIGGAALTDPETGDELSRVMFNETFDQAYTGLWQPPAFGSLWDVDRGTGRLHRFDPLTGEELAVIETGDPAPALCDDPQTLIGVEGLPPSIMVNCTGEVYLVDSETNTVVRSIHVDGYPFAAAGGLWSVSMPRVTGLGWWLPGAISRLDPATGTPVDALTLSRDRTWAHTPVVVGDSLWLVVGEQAAPNQGYDHNTTLIRIPLSELAG